MKVTQMSELAEKGTETVIINVFHMLKNLSRGKRYGEDPIFNQLPNELIPRLDGKLEMGGINQVGYLSRANRGRMCEVESRILIEEIKISNRNRNSQLELMRLLVDCSHILMPSSPLFYFFTCMFLYNSCNFYVDEIELKVCF